MSRFFLSVKLYTNTTIPYFVVQQCSIQLIVFVDMEDVRINVGKWNRKIQKPIMLEWLNRNLPQTMTTTKTKKKKEKIRFEIELTHTHAKKVIVQQKDIDPLNRINDCMAFVML